MKFASDSTLNKLILLFVFDKMEISLTENTILDLCTSRNNWLTYMDCMEALGDLIRTNFIYSTTKRKKDNLYSLTPEGRICLAHFYDRIPASLRSQIVDNIKQNCLIFKRRQEYFSDYFQNADGSYTVLLKINDPVQPMLEIRLNVDNRSTAKAIFNKWEQSAPQVFSAINELLLD